MSKEIYISSTPHETRLAIVEKDELTELYYERENEYTLAGSIYNGRVTRVLPGMQSSFVDIGLERDAFLYITDFMEEAGDAADFESAATAGEPRRNSGSGAGFGAGGGQPAEGGERKDRDRGRGRGRSEGRSDGRGEGRNEGRNEGRGEGRSFAPAASPGAGDGTEPVALAAPVADSETIGEGEPGADGSRRWRGRRGRRRGRGEGRAAGEATGTGEAGVAGQGTTYEEEEGGGFGRQHEAIDAGDALDGFAEPGAAQTAERSGGAGDGPARREGGGRGRRGGRGRDRDRGPRTEGQSEVQGEAHAEFRNNAQSEAASDSQPEEVASVAAAPAPSETAPTEVVRTPGMLESIRERFTPRWLRGSSSATSSTATNAPGNTTSTASSNTPVSVPSSTDSAVPSSTRTAAPGATSSSARSHLQSSGAKETVELRAAAEARPSAAKSVPEPEPFILPGESLSKYRRGEEGRASHAAVAAHENLIVAKPSTESAPITGWDGGSVLPGETLSRRGNSPAATGASSQRGGDRNAGRHGDRGGDRNAGRNVERGGERGNDRSAARTPERGADRTGGGGAGRPSDRNADRGAERSTAGAAESNAGRGGERSERNERGERGERSGSNRRRGRDGRRGQREEATRPAQGAGSSQQEAIPTSYRAVPGISAAEAVQPAVTSAHEFETPIPVHAVAPGFEAEQTAVPLPHETPYETQTDGVHHVQGASSESAEAAVEFHELVAEYEPEEASASYRVDPGAREFRQSAPVDDHAPVQAEAATQHEVTEIHSNGEMHSEAHHAGQETVSSVAEVHAASNGFAPGEGQLEEELLDDEESEHVPHLHASAEHEDMEEETLEGAADLASMIRDMSIDQITRPEPVELDGEDEEGELDGDGDDDDDENDDFDIDEEELEEDEQQAEGEVAEELETSASAEHHDGEEHAFAEGDRYDENGELMARAPVAPQASQREGGRSGRRGRGRGRDRERAAGTDRHPEGTADTVADAGVEREAEGGGEERGGGGRNGERSSNRSGSGGRDHRGMAGSRSREGRSGGRGDNRRHSVQASDLPAISDLLKPGQEVLVQIAKEPIAKKGARITSHIALPGRFLVFMPTVSHVGVSRKIESDGERRRLKEILLSERGEATGGFIVRTAAAGASEEELRSDLRFLLNLWADIKTRSESSKSPALIYHDLNLIERILRDQVTDNFSAIWVDTEAEYERVLRFLQRFQPSLIRRVKLYSKETPLFEQFGITAEIDKALRSKVWLKSGGSIVINQTEALVAIDINTGKFVGKTTKLEDTIVKTNLDAIPEIVRQMRLRDLGGIIIIDFIDMDERKNRNRVMAALEEELKKDRAPSKMLPFNDFGLIAITRKRVKQTLERTLSTTCGVCQGTGMTKSPVTVCNDIYIEMRKMHKLSTEKGDVMLRVHPEVVKQLKSGGGKWLQDMEELSKKTILIKSDPTLHPEQFDIH